METSSIDPFMKELKDYVEEHGLTLHHIYNADESGLYYKIFSNRTLVTCNEKTASGRIIIPCSNPKGTDILEFVSC